MGSSNRVDSLKAGSALNSILFSGYAKLIRILRCAFSTVQNTYHVIGSLYGDLTLLGVFDEAVSERNIGASDFG